LNTESVSEHGYVPCKGKKIPEKVTHLPYKVMTAALRTAGDAQAAIGTVFQGGV